jgi:exopolysaccharide production protein ExoQ
MSTAMEQRVARIVPSWSEGTWRLVPWWATVISLSCLVLNAALGSFAPAIFLFIWMTFAAAWPLRSLDHILSTAVPWAFPAIALTSVLWSLDPVGSAKLGIELAATTASSILIARNLSPRDFVSAFMCAMQPACYVSLLLASSVNSNHALTGVFASKNMLSYFAGLSMLSAASVLAGSNRSRTLRLVAVSAIFVAPVLLLRSDSVGGIATVGIATLVFGCCAIFRAISARWRGAVLASAVALTIVAAGSVWSSVDEQKDNLLASVGKNATLTNRTILWDWAGKYIDQRPLLGTGYQAFWEISSVEANGMWRVGKVPPGSGFHFHNLYYESMVELGAVGTIVLGLTMVLTLSNIVRWQFWYPDAESGFFMALAVLSAIRAFVEVDFIFSFGVGSALLPIAYVQSNRMCRLRT